MLELRTLTKHFGGVRAVDGLDITVEQGQIFGLIGPNGSGKSTTVNLICGVFPVTAGSVRFEGDEITNNPPHVALRSGIARTFQNIRLFSDLTVWQNLWVAQNGEESVRAEGFVSRWLSGNRRQRASVQEQLEFSGLADKRDELAGSLAFGEQRRLELARALAARPKLLLLDEPAAGMNLEEVKQLDERLRWLNEQQGITILLVEHVMELVMGVTHRIAALNFGRKIAEGSPAEIQQNQAVQEAYLGRSEDGGGEGEGTSLNESLLNVNDIATAYGNIEALKGVNLAAADGEITCLLGPNGAGKTTLMMTIAGILKPRRGSITLRGEEIAGRAPRHIVERGIALVPENRLVFPDMTVEENLRAGAFARNDAAGVDQDVKAMFARFPVLDERSSQNAGTLSGGEQQMLAISRALMARPKLLLMDEPSLGLAPLIVADIFRIIRELNEDGTTIFLVEQNVHMALQVAHHFYLIEQGLVVFDGVPGEMEEDEVIKRAYLGAEV